MFVEILKLICKHVNVKIVLVKMDEVYVNKVKCVENYLKRINPLAFVLEKDALNELMMSSELLDINGEQKKSIKKK